MSLLATTLWALVAAGAELSLPADEDPAEWADAISVSGLRAVRGAATLSAGGVLTVQRTDGTTATRMVGRPSTDSERETIAILAVSLLRPLAVTLPSLPPPEPEPEPRVVAQPKPRPKPTPAPEPEPVPVPVVPEPVVTVPEPADSSAEIAVVGSALGRASPAHGGGGGAAIGLLRRGQSWWVGGEVGVVVHPSIDAEQVDRSLAAAELAAAAGWTTARLWPDVGVWLGGSGRSYRLEREEVAAVNVPFVGLGLAHGFEISEDSRLRGVLRLDRDLRTVQVSSARGPEGALPQWSVTAGLGVALAVRR